MKGQKVGYTFFHLSKGDRYEIVEGGIFLFFFETTMIFFFSRALWMLKRAYYHVKFLDFSVFMKAVLRLFLIWFTLAPKVRRSDGWI